ncbi:uncharacterized protein LOC133485260 [Phyllopteryx taeniolatus]|uniref:uncharacterized protein LOC133485260 n=1 Tax=Phyllopteryx taeniolatus TaxID=161469 RepID=UPI002AD26F05|nr:uncharacterized protein LOC133485260 [Phyllopteryx taeniolatus]
MGSLKDEMRNFGKENGERSDEDPVAEGPLMSANQESTGRGGSQTELLHNVSPADDHDSCLEKMEDAQSGKVCGNSLQSDFISVKDSEQTDAVHLKQQSEGDRTTAADGPSHRGDDIIQIIDNTAEDKVLFSLPSTAEPSDPNSPAPFGQHHMRTQVSLEVVQCHSAATSPMTPPEGDHSFIFPSSFRRPGADAEMQVGRQVEFCSVATSPMTPKTPSTTAFPALTGRDGSGTQMITPTAKFPAEAAVPLQSQVEASNHQCKQQRMGSMDQDITILVTHYDNDKVEEKAREESSCYSVEMIKIVENDKKDFKREEKVSTESDGPDQRSNTKPAQKQIQASETSVSPNQTSNIIIDIKQVIHEEKEVSKPPVPESPAPDGCHNIRTQVSLEVVQCHSVATSPMTPPEGNHAFHFPSHCQRNASRTTNAKIEVGQQVEYRSVATAPMTPRTPTVMTFTEIRKEASTGKNNDEQEEDEKVKEEKEEVIEENVVKEAEEENDCKEKSEEVVQEVSWDEKGMTWEVYGAVVEVAVLGSAIQKHLEKQVKKQKSQPSLPPPPPLNPSATPLAYEAAQGGSARCREGKTRERDDKVARNRRNPFRLLMENMQQPHCCSRAHTTE